jgi:ABC-type multidrug transport system fused ATPase/permease subunit
MSFFSRILFSQSAQLIKLGKKRFIVEGDALTLPDYLSPYKKSFNEELIDWGNGRSIYLSFLKASGSLFVKTVLLQIVASAFAFGTPLFVNHFVSSLQVSGWTPENIRISLLFALGLGVCAMGHGIMIQHYFFRTLNMNQITINILNKKIFEHALKLSYLGKQKYQIGDIVNFMSSDADAIGDSAITTVDLCNAILMLVGGSAMLFYFMGWSSIVAVVVMVTLIPLTQKLAKKFTHLEEEMMAHRDKRMTVMSQIMAAIRVVKYFSWEKSVEAEVAGIRDMELRARTQLAKAEIGWGLIYASISSVVLFSALLTHYLRGLEITLPMVLTAVSIFSMMENQFGGLSRFIGRFINIFVSGQRISDFLKSHTLEPVERKFTDTAALQIKNLNFQFNNEMVLFQNLNLTVHSSQSLAIIGAVGSGKSTLLQILLGEIQNFSGEVVVPSENCSYVSQESYIVNSTLRENIVFGTRLDTDSKERIESAIWASCLDADLSLLPGGLDTEIGERGVNLSGGQKQRVSLARAALAHPEVIFLDDPLSALDPDTEKSVCDRLIFGLWSNKMRIVVTHRVSQLHRFDQVLFLQDDKYEIGTFDELKSNSLAFQNFLQQEVQNKIDEQDMKNSLEAQKTEFTKVGVASIDHRITVDEDRAIGSVEKSVYFSYLKALGGESKQYRWILGGMFFMAILLVSSPLMQKAWLTRAGSGVSPGLLVTVYGFLGLFTLLVTYVNNFIWTTRGIQAGRSFHERILKSILNTPIRFFDSTPVGRILQRFSRDVESVDMHLQWSFDNTIHSIFHVLVALTLIVVSLPIAILFLLPILGIYYFLQNDYRRVAREVKRLDSLARSPRYAHFRETLNGLSVLRAYGRQDWFVQQFLQKLHRSTQMFYTHYMVNRWFSARLPIIGALISVGTAFCITIATSRGWMSAALGGLVTLYALEFWQHLNWGVRIFSDLESRMTSVERLEFYAQLPTEHDPKQIEISNWPNSGKLEFQNVALRYAEHLPLVLKNVSFEIPTGARVGIVGRTGSGKSTLFQAVYRFVNIENGDILIDDQSIKNISLHQLRSQLAVIPQDPNLFMGTLRSNLDRYHEKTDDEVWAVLKKAELAEFVSALPKKLFFQVTEGGSNLSQGQRQLICLARALLMKVKIIFLDEATASVDIETDAVVQKVIRESLDGITLVTIAHRISTLKDYDMIIELNNGEVSRIQKLS